MSECQSVSVSECHLAKDSEGERVIVFVRWSDDKGIRVTEGQRVRGQRVTESEG